MCRYNVPELVSTSTPLLSAHISHHTVLLLLQACLHCRGREPAAPPVIVPPSRARGLLIKDDSEESEGLLWDRSCKQTTLEALENPSQHEPDSWTPRSCPDNQQLLSSCSKSCEDLLSSCLRFIDQNAKQVLGHPQFRKLDSSVVSLIIGRDTLAVPSELTVVKALSTWVKQQGSSALGGAQYLVRYLNLSVEEVEAGVVGAGLLTTAEEQSILDVLQGRGNLPEHLLQLR